jgi:hypothetical protein
VSSVESLIAFLDQLSHGKKSFGLELIKRATLMAVGFGQQASFLLVMGV